MTSKNKRVVILSDLHLGEEESILHTSDGPNNNLRHLGAMLTRLGKINELILLGDFMDFSLASSRKAYDNARNFMSIVCSAGNIGKIVYVPGNHDHHVWVQLVEAEQIVKRIAGARLPPASAEYGHKLVESSFDNDGKDNRG